MSNTSTFTKQFNEDGTKNPKYVDVLDEDKPLAGQKYTCISFISPENIIKDKNLFLFREFLNQWDMNKSLEKYNQFLNFISYKHDIDFTKLSEDFQEFCTEEKGNLFTTTLDDEYKTFIDNNEERLNTKYDKEHSFQTSTRGVKVRGSYPSQREAELRAQVLRESDPNHDVYVGPVGLWMPFHPEAYKTGRVEYMEDELNQLMTEKNKNENKAKVEFENRVKEAKKKAIEDNIKKAEESGNVLTQTLDKEGNLVSVKDSSTFEGDLGKDVSIENIRDKLFNDENVVLTGNNHRHPAINEE